ncbi:MAG: alpha/beta hydrolase family protein [Promethearchaeota archaeon]
MNIKRALNLVKHQKKNILKGLIALNLVLSVVFIGFGFYYAFMFKIHRNTIIQNYSNEIDLVIYPDPEDSSVHLSGSVFYPKYHNASSEALPLVLLQHGMGGLKENMISMALNFVKRGFIVGTFDLRRHGHSTGTHTFGVKESDDLVYAINYIIDNYNGTIFNVSSIGIVGHSMGAITAIMTSYKYGLNSCVAISPATFIRDFLTKIGHGNPLALNNYLGSINPLDDADFIENITISNYIKDRINENPPRTKNLLLCGTLEDFVVPASSIYELFKNITKLDSPLNNTLYGSFSLQNATQCNIYTKGIHGDEQFSWKTPKITLDAINWTERALLGEQKSLERGPLNVSDLILEDLKLYSPQLNMCFNLSFIFIFSLIFFLLFFIEFGKETTLFTSFPEEYNYTILHMILKRKIKKSSGSDFSSFSRFPSSSKSISSILNILFLIAIGFLIGLIFSNLYTPGFIGTIIPEIIIRLLGIESIPICIMLLIFIIFQNKNIDNKKTHRSGDFLQKYGIANSKSSLVRDLIAGTILATYLPLINISITYFLGLEQIFKPIVHWGLFFKIALFLGLIIFVNSIFSYGYLMRQFCFKNQILNIFVPFILLPIYFIIYLTLSSVLFIFDPFITGIFAYAGFVVPIKAASVLLVSLILTIFSFMTSIFVRVSKSIIIPISFAMWFVPFFILSILPPI